MENTCDDSLNVGFRDSYQIPKIIMKECDRIAKRFKREGIDFEEAFKFYDVCNNCAIYTKNLTPEIAKGIYNDLGIKPESCFGIRFLPSIDKKKLVFQASGKCKGYLNLSKYKINFLFK